ncbi:MAG TPA: nitroreductase family deazaflavin-dependent oxidoreductase [Acidimicrobiales bacterium]|jgi:deazaflavin-dependent oxidoreductase (nitroreductase family)
MTADRPSSARPDLRERIIRQLFRLVNPLALRMITAGVPTGAPNVLLVVRGHRSGTERTTPVTLLDFEGRSYVQATYGAPGWGRNLRAAGEATMIRPGGQRTPVHAIEVPPDEAATILRRALEPYRQVHLLRRLLGSRVRPPVGLLRRYRLRVDDTPQDYFLEARRHPLFELRPA